MGRAEVGSVGNPYRWVVFNEGEVASEALVLEGDFVNFEVENECTSSPPPPDASCSIDIRFAPVVGGALSTTFILTDGNASVDLLASGRALVRIEAFAEGVGLLESAELDCGVGGCTGALQVGEVVAITATTENGSGYFFSGWSEDACQGGSEPARKA